MAETTLDKILKVFSKEHDTRKEAKDATEKKNDAPVEPTGVTGYGSYIEKSQKAIGE